MWDYSELYRRNWQPEYETELKLILDSYSGMRFRWHTECTARVFRKRKVARLRSSALPRLQGARESTPK